jgi:hypothetical protein
MMEQPITIFAAISVFLVVIGVISGIFYGQYLRRQMWRRLAAKYGMRYNAYDPYDIPEKFEFALFKEGHSREACNCLDGIYQELPVILFDYSYKIGSGKSQTAHELSALLARLSIPCRKLIIRPETMIDRIANFLGLGDIQFEYEQFNRTFDVQSEDKKFAYDVCHPAMMEFMLKYPTMTWELQGQHLLLYSADVEFDAESAPRCLEIAIGFAKRIPQYMQVEERA